MSPTPPRPTSQVTFLYYDDLEAARHFYEDVMGFKLVEDQGFAKIYQITATSFIGTVTGERGHHPVRAENSVILALAVDDVMAWHAHLVAHDVPMQSEPGYSERIQVEGFFAQDPGGYTVEIERFAKPELAAIFHQK